ncbi:MAG: OmpA family protein, partial [Gammaproteobacteria bacterium]
MPGRNCVRRRGRDPGNWGATLAARGRTSSGKPDDRSTVGAGAGTRPRRFRGTRFFLIFALLLPFIAQAMTPPGTSIRNTATVNFTDFQGAQSVTSNEVEIITVVGRTDAQLSFIKLTTSGTDTVTFGITACLVGGSFSPLPDPVLFDGTPLDPNQPADVYDASMFHAGEPLFFRLIDHDQNLDAAVIETVDITVTSSRGDSETLQLSETAADTGVFTGYVPSSSGPVNAGDCLLQTGADGTVDASYTDPADPTDSETTQVLVDPLGVVFDSQTGQPVDGAGITLIDDTTGQPAVVFGDDGVSSFPATVTSGGSAQDSAGTVYQFPPGGFRFPAIAPGNYRLEIQPAAGHTAPSTVGIATLQALPGAPFALGPESYGSVFVVNPGPIVFIDVPVDPQANALFIQKTTPMSVASAGDFVPYSVSLQNTAQNLGTSTLVIDLLPPGFRYVPGSARLDGATLADPIIASDGRGLTFDLGDLSPGDTVNLRYVTEVTVGTSKGDAINLAAATADNMVSNDASALVRIEDAFFSDTFIVGRVVLGACDDDLQNDLDGMPGVRIYLEDGRYVVTDEGGRYHFEGVPAGTHVVQVDTETLPEYMQLVPCQNSRFAGRTFSQFVDVDEGALWRVDFYAREIPVPTGSVRLHLSSILADGAIDYRLKLAGKGVAVDQLNAMVMLPEGTNYIPGSTQIDEAPRPDPRVTGNVLSWRFDPIDTEWERVIRFRATLPPNTGGNYVTKAVVRFDTPVESNRSTPVAENIVFREGPNFERHKYNITSHLTSLSAELSAVDLTLIDAVIDEWNGTRDIHIEAVGHSDNLPIAPRNRNVFADNKALSMARARAAADYVRQRLGIKEDQITIAGRGDEEPIASNDTAEGRAANRRVELFIERTTGDVEGALHLVKSGSGMQQVETLGVEPGRDVDNEELFGTDSVAESVTELYNDTSWLEIAEPGAEWFLPTADFNPAIPSLKIAVKHAADETVELFVNGEQVSALNFDGVTVNSSDTVALSRWRGVDIEHGDNELTAVLRNAAGEVTELTRTAHYSGGPARAEFIAERSILIADGRTRPVIALQLYDQAGYPARPNAIGNFRVDPPYRSWWEVESLNRNQLLAVNHRKPIYTIGPDGVALIELEPTTQSGEAVVHLLLPRENTRPLEDEFRVWLKPAARDWILVGLAEGTFGYNTIADNIQLAEDAGFVDDLYDDGRLAFFAKGRIRGDYLLTIGFDSEREADTADRLKGVIEPDRFYPIYGDATEQQFDAASIEKLYLKIERNQFYALFGDYDTGLTMTDLSRYSRSMSGLKSEYRGEQFGYSAFAAETNLNFARDELRGDGTSGLYSLSQSPILINSDKVTIQVRDRFRPEIVISSTRLTRFLDYSIDYINGTLLFKEPIPFRDENLNPTFIVAEYEVRNSSEDALNGGGRASMFFGDGRAELGVSAIHEGADTGDGDLGGMDFSFWLTDLTELNLEYATSTVEETTGDRDGDAYIAELFHRSERFDGHLYYRELDEGFGLGQQSVTERATRRSGVDARYRINEELSVQGEVFRQDNLAVDTQRDAAQAEIRYERDGRYGSAGLSHVRDEEATGRDRVSQQVFLTGGMPVWDDRIMLRTGLEVALSGKDESLDYPNRFLLGADYRFSDSVTFFGEHEIAQGADIDAQTSRVGIKASPWNLAQFSGGLNQQLTESGARTFMNLGLIQGFQLNDHWTLDFGLDQSNTIRSPGAEPMNPEVPLASGTVTDDFTAFFVGGGYRKKDWSWTSRLEFRNADSEDRFGFLTGLYRENRLGHGLSASAQLFQSETVAGATSVDGDLRLGWAYRPAGSEWIVFDRFDL